MSDENVISMNFFEAKVDGSDVIAGICKEVRDSRYDITSVNFRQNVTSVKKVHEDDIFVRQDILQFFSGESKDYKYLKSP